MGRAAHILNAAHEAALGVPGGHAQDAQVSRPPPAAGPGTSGMRGRGATRSITCSCTSPQGRRIRPAHAPPYNLSTWRCSYAREPRPALPQTSSWLAWEVSGDERAHAGTSVTCWWFLGGRFRDAGAAANVEHVVLDSLGAHGWHAQLALMHDK